MNCTLCRQPATITDPLPLCRTDALRVIAAYADVALSAPAASRPSPQRQPDAEEEIRTLYALLDAEGWNTLDLNRAMCVLSRPKATAARRLAEARKRYASELNRRARRSEHGR